MYGSFFEILNAKFINLSLFNSLALAASKARCFSLKRFFFDGFAFFTNFFEFFLKYFLNLCSKKFLIFFLGFFFKELLVFFFK